MTNSNERKVNVDEVVAYISEEKFPHIDSLAANPNARIDIIRNAIISLINAHNIKPTFRDTESSALAAEVDEYHRAEWEGPHGQTYEGYGQMQVDVEPDPEHVEIKSPFIDDDEDEKEEDKN